MSDKFFARILYAKDFYNAWEYVPFLLISIVFGATAGYIGGIFSALKEAKMLAQSTTIGAVVNIILRFMMIEDAQNFYGIYYEGGKMDNRFSPKNTTVIICCAGMGTRLGIQMKKE